ncbi:FAD/NAD(P)-binding domain-containing protein [Obba rivulosa]|uniref:FAD/NAD(P)-binding domain-containing protein n=1 Tax=Obba rivulosa TaxID=1052685 RepID=A0A8E2DG32_9APHY|nr:FAD/NAD(P)-binding domain-containing protein [Obba rivulosa]
MCPKFRVAICGAAADEIGTTGAGLAVFKRTWSIFQHLGLDEQMRARGIPCPTEGETVAGTIHVADQKTEGEIVFRLVVPFNFVGLARMDLVHMLQRLVPKNCTIYTSKRLISYSAPATGQITLNFADGSAAATDVLVGADGIRSVDPEMGRAAVNPRWSGTHSYRCMIPAEKLKNVFPEHPALRSGQCYSGKSKHIMAYPVSGGHLVNFIGYHSDPEKEGTSFDGKWSGESTKEEVVSYYHDWEPQVQALMQCLGPNLLRESVHVLSDLPRCADGRVALLGDAFHAMTTNVSAGAGQAMEDAYVLGHLLAHPLVTLDTVAHTLKVYEDARLEFANRIITTSRDIGLLYEFNGPIYDGSRGASQETLDQWGKAIYERWEFQWNGSPAEELQHAKEQLEAGLTSGSSTTI